MVTSENKCNSYSNWEARLPMQSLGAMKVTLTTDPENEYYADSGGATQKKKKKKKKSRYE